MPRFLANSMRHRDAPTRASGTSARSYIVTSLREHPALRGMFSAWNMAVSGVSEAFTSWKGPVMAYPRVKPRPTSTPVTVRARGKLRRQMSMPTSRQRAPSCLRVVKNGGHQLYLPFQMPTRAIACLLYWQLEG